MMRRHQLFIALLLMLFLIGAFLLGGSITGMVAQTMYCNEEGCADLCRSELDCDDTTTICCHEGGVGVCKDMNRCEKPYEFIVGVTQEIDIDSRTEYSLAENNRDRAYLYVIGVIALLIVLVIFLHESRDRPMKGVNSPAKPRKK